MAQLCCKFSALELQKFTKKNKNGKVQAEQQSAETIRERIL
jgi:hypothetical protein